MVLTKREKYIAIGVAAAVGLLVLDSLAFTPYFEARKALRDGRNQLRLDNDAALTTFERARKLRNIWAELQRGGLMVDSSVAESQSEQAILDWAKNAGVEVASVRPERATAAQKFQIINFSVTGTGPLSSISKLLWSLETASIPVRITDMTITPRREGTDDLSVRLGVSALCMPPATADKTSIPPTADARDAGGGA
jgi:hypothetical protein